ncbi:MAG: ATP-dependent RecD-like DNA helicase [Desulfobacteraceae bacterium]|jgi:exodeoxyribonuclease V alpha subunit
MANDDQGSLTDLVGEIERITYSDDTSGFTIAQVQPVGRRRSITVVGNFVDSGPGTVLKMKGQWTEHPKFGRQFKAMEIETRQPVTAEGIEKFLGSGPIKGIGPETARRIVQHFKEKTLDIIEHQPERLSEVQGIGDKRISMIQQAWEKQQGGRHVMLFLQSHGVSPAYAIKIFRQYGPGAVEIVRKNPYRLAHDVSGIGFLIADKIAGRLGYDNVAPLRLQAGILYVLHQLAEEGHLFFPYEALITKSQSILRSPREPIIAAVDVLCAEKKIVMEDLENGNHKEPSGQQAVYLSRYYQCEKFTAEQLHRLMGAPRSPSVTDTRQAVQWIQKRFKLELASKQQHAIAKALTSKVLVITGGPGTGKTTIVRAITRVYEHLHARLLLAAPTGRAAKRLSESAGRPAKTIHRLLEYNPSQGGFQKNQYTPLDVDLLVVDEASMIDAVLMYHLLKAVPATTTLILVGDVNQLPSVGPGNVLKDILASRSVPQVTLSEIFRQARNSHIIMNAHRINAGKMPRLEAVPADDPCDFYFITQKDPEKILSTILTLAGQRIPRRFGFDTVDDIQVLTPMHRGVVGSENLNRQLQQTLNPQDAHIARGDQRFGLYDKVMQIRNNYEKNVFNGDIGRIAVIDPKTKTASIRFDDRTLVYDFTEMDELVLAYAISVHKSQGSEYPAVIIPVTTAHYLLLQRNLIYTGITRAKQLVVLVGTPQAMAMAVKNNTPHKRHTRLAHRLRQMVGESGSRQFGLGSTHERR